MQYLAQRPDRVDGGMLDFPHSVEDLFHRFWGGLAKTRAGAWVPAVDIIETPQAYLVLAEIPGINAEDVDVTLTGDSLTIRGEKKLEGKLADESWCLSERVAGSFERTFRLPAPVSSQEIEAHARDGVLTIKVMKAKEAQTRKISVRQG